MLQNKNILIGVTAGIAAYKIPFLIRLLVKSGANVKVIITKDALQFVTAETLSVLSKNEVIVDFFDTNKNWNNHVKLAEWADMMLIAPLTANTLAKLASGLCDNVLLATYLSASCKVFVAPAMDLEMYQHPTTRQNLDTLIKNGNSVIPAETGELASGLSGEGRMAEPETIVSFIETQLKSSLPLFGKKVLINAGPTHEAIDPVRFIGNKSSGKMGIAIADYCAQQGADVHLVLGPTNFYPANKRVCVTPVVSAKQMFDACIASVANYDIIICSAAVADYKPKDVSKEKIKKSSDELQLTLEQTNDILLALGKTKTKNQCLVGFALETENLEAYAKDKLQRKNLDIIIANNATNKNGSVFGSDQNQITIIDKSNKITNFELMLKNDSAREIVNYIIAYLGSKVS